MYSAVANEFNIHGMMKITFRFLNICFFGIKKPLIVQYCIPRRRSYTSLLQFSYFLLRFHCRNGAFRSERFTGSCRPMVLDKST